MLKKLAEEAKGETVARKTESMMLRKAAGETKRSEGVRKAAEKAQRSE